MIRGRARAAILAVALPALAGGCGSGAAPSGSTGGAPAPAEGPLPAGIVARAGPRTIAAASVARIAAAQKVDVAAARDRAVRDALLADGAEARALDQDVDVRLSTRAVLARRLLRELRAEAARTPPTGAELDEAALDLMKQAGIPASLVADEVLADVILTERTRAAADRILAPGRGGAERARDADALLSLIGSSP